MWSPRRFHAGVYFNGYIWIMGGRAREFVTLPHSQSIGGIKGPLVQDIPLVLGNEEQQFRTQREIAYLKNDVWKSADGNLWDLVTPGCRVDQNAQGTKQYACTTTNDCYGSEVCEKGTCVCGMWGPREHHAVATYNGYMYVSGGFGAQLYPNFSQCGIYACGDIDATTYRIYLSDVWRSQDGNSWVLITDRAFADPLIPGYSIPSYRGGHQMLAFTDYKGNPYLWVFGGQGGPNNPEGGSIVYYNDIWRAPLQGNTPNTWELVNVTDEYGSATHIMPWTNRTGHGVVLETGTADNLNTRRLYLYGGQNNGTYLNDLWSWRFDDPNEFWRQDFTSAAYFSTGDGDTFHYQNSSPARFYVTPDSNLSSLRRFWIPADPSSNSYTPYQLRPYLTTSTLAAMNSVGLNTIRELAEADVYTILKLRGYDYPSVPTDQRLKVYDICDYRALAIAVVEKCSVTLPSLYDGERQMPWNIIPVFGGAPPKNQTIKWHKRRNYNFLLPAADDPVTLTEEWDGCTYNSKIEGLFGPNVPGLGNVKQVTSIKNPASILQNLFCQQTPQARAYHGMVLFEERLYVLGGQLNSSYFYADTWYRDERLPNAQMRNPPKSHTSNPYFKLSSDKAGCYYEYRIWDPYNFKEVRGWAPVVKKASVSWLNWRKGGPGTGRYQIYFRAVDPAGNRDYGFQMGENVYNWYYVSPTPWDIIFSVIGAFIGLCIAAYFEYRRRVKKAAMERYAMKRMRRKFKAMQRDIDGKAVDWRTLYMESKQAEEAAGALKDKKKKIKKTKDKAAEKREKEKKKRYTLLLIFPFSYGETLNREKEKELIKKKLKAAKDYKDKKKVSSGPHTISLLLNLLIIFFRAEVVEGIWMLLFKPQQLLRRAIQRILRLAKLSRLAMLRKISCLTKRRGRVKHLTPRLKVVVKLSKWVLVRKLERFCLMDQPDLVSSWQRKIQKLDSSNEKLINE